MISKGGADVIPLIVTTTVRERVSGEAAGSGEVLTDLNAGGWTLMPTVAPSNGGGKPRRGDTVRMFGRRFGYFAILARYELPPGWCVCPSGAACTCRETDPGDTPHGTVKLIGAFPIRDRDRYEAAAGDRYDDHFRLSAGARGLLDIAERWTRAQRRVRRTIANATTSPMRLWELEVAFRADAAKYFSAPISYGEVRVEEGDMIFDVSADVRAGKEAVYRLPGDDHTELIVAELEQGVLRMEVQRGDPVAVAAHAERLSGKQRVLTRDHKMTQGTLRREGLVLRDALAGNAVNPLLIKLMDRPDEAKVDDWLDVHPEAVDPPLDPAQHDALISAVKARDLLIVQGPPGTGKTTFVCELIVNHLKAHPGDKVLMASQTHQATDNLLGRIAKRDPDLALLRIGRDADKISPETRRYWIDAEQPWQAGARQRVEQARRYLATLKLNTSESDAETITRILEIQDRYTLSEGSQDEAGKRIATANVIAGTCYGVASERRLRDQQYGLVVLEEAAKASATEALMVMLRAQKIVMIGDTRQLPPTPDHAIGKILRDATRDPLLVPEPLRGSAMELAQELKRARAAVVADGSDPPPEHGAETMFAHLARRVRSERPDLEQTLRTQYRMVSGIGELVSHVFYDGHLEHARRLKPDEGRDHRLVSAGYTHVELLHVDGHEKFVQGSHSAANPAEVTAIIKRLRALERVARQDPDKPLGVAVITGYARQLRAIEAAVSREADNLKHLRTRVGMIDRFQGDEEQVVILSTTRTKAPGYLRDRARINVAISRAEDLLTIVGHTDRMRAGALGQPIQEVVEFIDRRAQDQRYRLTSAERL